jgi:DNA-binding NarL/FixJ family response regulator
VDALLVLGCAVAHSDRRRAAQLFAAAEHLRAQQDAPLAPKTYAQIVPYVRMVHEGLGADEFAEAWRSGEGLSLDQTIALALARPAIPGADTGPSAPALPASARAASPAGPDDLTLREQEVLQLLARGLTNQEIADQLIMSVHTVRSHVKAIFSKLDVTSRAAATRAALDRGLVGP